MSYVSSMSMWPCCCRITIDRHMMSSTIDSYRNIRRIEYSHKLCGHSAKWIREPIHLKNYWSRPS